MGLKLMLKLKELTLNNHHLRLDTTCSQLKLKMNSKNILDMLVNLFIRMMLLLLILMKLIFQNQLIGELKELLMLSKTRLIVVHAGPLVQHLLLRQLISLQLVNFLVLQNNSSFLAPTDTTKVAVVDGHTEPLGILKILHKSLRLIIHIPLEQELQVFARLLWLLIAKLESLNIS